MIVSLEQLCDGHRLGQDDSRRVVLSVGCFDLLHTGHVEHLRQAKAMGDVLVVGVTADRHVAKGPGRPLFPETQRACLLDTLKPVDYVIIVDSPSATGIIETLNHHVYVKGPDYVAGQDPAGNLEAERLAVEGVGGRLSFTDGDKQSSTEIIRRLKPHV